jgi:hypothetical protein
MPWSANVAGDGTMRELRMSGTKTLAAPLLAVFLGLFGVDKAQTKSDVFILTNVEMDGITAGAVGPGTRREATIVQKKWVPSNFRL